MVWGQFPYCTGLGLCCKTSHAWRMGPAPTWVLKRQQGQARRTHLVQAWRPGAPSSRRHAPSSPGCRTWRACQERDRLDATRQHRKQVQQSNVDGPAKSGAHHHAFGTPVTSPGAPRGEVPGGLTGCLSTPSQSHSRPRHPCLCPSSVLTDNLHDLSRARLIPRGLGPVTRRLIASEWRPTGAAPPLRTPAQLFPASYAGVRSSTLSPGLGSSLSPRQARGARALRLSATSPGLRRELRDKLLDERERAPPPTPIEA